MSCLAHFVQAGERCRQIPGSEVRESRNMLYHDKLAGSCMARYKEVAAPSKSKGLRAR